MAALNYSRMPGQGDLAGDDRNPNSPYYVEPVFDREDAINNVAAKLVKRDDVAELVMHVANARALLAWISCEIVIPRHLRIDWAELERQAINLDREVNCELAVLNGEGA